MVIAADTSFWDWVDEPVVAWLDAATVVLEIFWLFASAAELDVPL